MQGPVHRPQGRKIKPERRDDLADTQQFVRRLKRGDRRTQIRFPVSLQAVSRWCEDATCPPRNNYSRSGGVDKAIGKMRTQQAAQPPLMCPVSGDYHRFLAILIFGARSVSVVAAAFLASVFNLTDSFSRAATAAADMSSGTLGMKEPYALKPFAATPWVPLFRGRCHIALRGAAACRGGSMR